MKRMTAREAVFIVLGERAKNNERRPPKTEWLGDHVGITQQGASKLLIAFLELNPSAFPDHPRRQKRKDAGQTRKKSENTQNNN